MRNTVTTALGFLLLASPLAAQDTAPGGIDDLSIGEIVEEDQSIGAAYVADVFGDWSLRCIRTEDGNDPCRLYQLLSDANGNSVAEISLFRLPDGEQAEAGATIITPLETLLTQQLTLAVDGGGLKRYPFTFCAQIGCVARVGFLSEDVEAFQRGAEAIMSIVPVAAPDQVVEVTVSLNGFTAGYQAVTEAPGNN